MTARSNLILLVSAFILVSTSQVRADELESKHWCGTSGGTIESVRALSSWTASRHRSQTKAVEKGAIRQSGDLLILDPDETLVPFDNPIDLVGQTYTFTPTSSNSFRVDRTPLDYDAEVGTLRTLPSNGNNDSILHSLQQFVFPFQGRSVRNFYISERFGVFLASPQADGGRPQLGPLDIATPKQGVIAPYLQPGLPRTLVRTTREVFVSENADRITITWRAAHNPAFAYNPLNDGALDIQLTLRANGEIRFSYRTLTNLAWGSAVITSGDEASRSQSVTLALVNDPTGDTLANAPHASLLDIRQVEVQRVAGSELLRVRMQLGGKVFPGVLTRQVAIRVWFDDNSDLVLFAGPSAWRYCVPGWGCSTAGGNVEFTNDSVVLYVLDRYFDNPTGFVAETFVNNNQRIDFVTGSIQLGAGTPVGVDLSALADDATVTSPVLEAFTVPVLNPDGVWERIREQYGLWDEEVDGVAIYQNFTTDIRTFATAYSTVGNSGADGVWAFSEGFYGSDVERRPALLHMNEVEPDRRDIPSLRYRDFLLGHELGHRWLYGFNIAHNGEASFVLGPDGGHPAQYVHMPAAFPVYTSRDYSVMGGSNFEDLGGGQYRTPEDIGAFGYTWHELYLMGLASPPEVDPWFYLADTEPRLGDVYHPPIATTVSGVRDDVRLHQMIETMGPRFPAHEESQRTFRVLFVMLDKPGGDSAEDESILQEYASRFPGYFSSATGGRGTITLSLPTAPQAQFAGPSRGVRGDPVAFRDSSGNYPAAWTWDFGDGTSSNEQFPQHAYRAPGTYTVTLRVRNSQGESSTSQSITIDPSPRSRPARR